MHYIRSIDDQNTQFSWLVYGSNMYCILNNSVDLRYTYMIGQIFRVFSYCEYITTEFFI
jgi:hypothetical protein